MGVCRLSCSPASHRLGSTGRRPLPGQSSAGLPACPAEPRRPDEAQPSALPRQLASARVHGLVSGHNLASAGRQCADERASAFASWSAQNVQSRASGVRAAPQPDRRAPTGRRCCGSRCLRWCEKHPRRAARGCPEARSRSLRCAAEPCQSGCAPWQRTAGRRCPPTRDPARRERWSLRRRRPLPRSLTGATFPLGHPCAVGATRGLPLPWFDARPSPGRPRL